MKKVLILIAIIFSVGTAFSQVPQIIKSYTSSSDLEAAKVAVGYSAILDADEIGGFFSARDIGSLTVDGINIFATADPTIVWVRTVYGTYAGDTTIVNNTIANKSLIIPRTDTINASQHTGSIIYDTILEHYYGFVHGDTNHWHCLDCSGGSDGGIESVTGNIVDNTDASNPIVTGVSPSDTASMLSPYLRSNVAADTYEVLSNKSTNASLGTSNTLYSTQNAVKVYVDNGLSVKLGIGASAGGDLSGTYPNPSVVWSNGYTTYDARYLVTSTGNSITWSVLDILNTPPGSPTSGDIYLVGTSPTGAFTSNANKIATYDGASWNFSSATTGDLLNNVDENSSGDVGVYQYSGSSWSLVSNTINPSAWIIGGISGFTNPKLGTIDNKSMKIITHNKQRLNISNAGAITWNDFTGSGSGFLKVDASGVMSRDNTTYLSSIDTTNISNFSVKIRSLFSATSPLTYSNGVFGINQSNTSTNGYLSSTDWNTFNNKIDQTTADARYFRIANNLSEGTAASMRSSLGLGSFATLTNPATTNKDFIYYDGSAYQRLAKGSNGQHMIINGSGNYQWVDSSASGGSGGSGGYSPATTGYTFHGVSGTTSYYDSLIYKDTTKNWTSVNQTITANTFAVYGSSYYKQGTVTVTGGAPSTVTGSGTQFLNYFHPGDYIQIGSEGKLIISIASNTSLTTITGFSSTYSGASYTKSSVANRLPNFMVSENGDLTMRVYKLYNQDSSFGIFGVNVLGLGIDALKTYNSFNGDNIAIGNYSMYSLSNGLNNTGIGAYSLYSGVTGAYNTAIGWKSLYNATNSNNTAVGSEALFNFTTSATGQTAVGYHALYTNSSGTKNTAIGTGSLALFTGSEATAVGYNSQAVNVSGNFNCSIGNGTLASATGGRNSAWGERTLQNLTSGTSNVAGGFESLNRLLTGTGNIVFGDDAAYNFTGSESNNIIFGNDNEAVTGWNRKFAVDYANRGTSDYLYGDMTFGSQFLNLNGKFGIKNISPSYELDVAGKFGVDGTSGKTLQSGTITAGGTTGAQTINKPVGSVNFAAGATSLVVTNSLVSTSSLVFCQIMTNDATATSTQVVVASGSFTIYLNAAATAETKVAFHVIDKL